MKKCFSPDFALSHGLAGDRFPETDDEVRQASEVLAMELSKLSLDEHEKILFDVHGIDRTDHQENPLMLEVGLQELEIELQNSFPQHHPDREAFDLARSMNAAYVDDPNFRRMFLRAESYNAKAAAEMLVGHFAAKQRIFGDGEILARDIRQSDLSRCDRGLLELGFVQVLPCRDAAGRTVVAMSPEFRKWGTKKELMRPISRACWYFNMALLRDEETQRKGTVLIMYNFCAYKEEVSFDETVHHMRSAMPQRVDAAHFCFNDTRLQSCATGIQLFIDPYSRFRLRSHFGTAQEIEFQLQTFGIPTADSPMQKDGTWVNEWHREWLAVQEAIEGKTTQQQQQQRQPPEIIDIQNQGIGGIEEETPAVAKKDSIVEQSVDRMVREDPAPAEQPDDMVDEIISLPRRFDVLFGKGKREREHTGNLRAMLICDMHWGKYEACTKFEKTELAERIISLIHESGGRFLKPRRKGGWIEVDDCAARAKIAHFFRFMRSKAKTIEDANSSTTGNSSVKRVTPCASPDLTASPSAISLNV